MATATLVMLLLVLVAASGVVARFLPAPLPLIQILLGMLLAWPASGLDVAVEPEVFLLVFIPPLLFLDGYLAPKREFAELKVPILGLALGLVFITIVVFGYALHWLIPAVPLPVAFALAAVLSPTDAVAVSSIVDKRLVPARVMHILEGESLLNDASGLVVFRIAVAAALTGEFSLAETALTFLVVATGGIIAGFVMLWLTAKALRLVARVGDVPPEVQVLLLFLLPFAAYLLAEHFHLSGILAAVTAGLYLGRSGLFGSMSVPARMQNLALIELLSFVFNGGVFLVLGLQLPAIIRAVPAELSVYGTVWEPVGAVILLTLVLIAIRFAWIVLGAALDRLRPRHRRLAERATLRIKVVIALAGVRGAITLAGILSLPLAMPDGTPFPARDLVIFIAAGVIVCSLGLASLTLPFVARGIPLEKQDVVANEERLARVTAAEAAISRIEQLVDAARPDPDLFEARQSAANYLIALYRQRLTSGETEEAPGQAMRKALEGLREEAMTAERAALAELMRQKKINDTTMRAIMSEVLLQQALSEKRRKKA